MHADTCLKCGGSLFLPIISIGKNDKGQGITQPYDEYGDTLVQCTKCKVILQATSYGWIIAYDC